MDTTLNKDITHFILTQVLTHDEEISNINKCGKIGRQQHSGKRNTCVKTQERKEGQGNQQIQGRDSLLRTEYAVREKEEMRLKQHAEEKQIHPLLLDILKF